MNLEGVAVEPLALKWSNQIMDSIRVKYEDGVFKPLKKPRKLKEGAIGEVHVDETRVETTRKTTMFATTRRPDGTDTVNSPMVSTRLGLAGARPCRLNQQDWLQPTSTRWLSRRVSKPEAGQHPNTALPTVIGRWAELCG